MAAALGVGGQRLLQLVGEAEIIHDQPARLVLEHAVHAGDGLHEAVAAHGFVQIHRVQARRVKAGQPHVADDDDLERVFAVLEPFRQRLPARFVADVILPFERVAGRAGHHDFHHALFVVPVMPLGPQLADGLVNLKADAPAHAHDHRLAVHDFEARLPMLDQILGDEADALIRADDGFQRRPLGFELFLVGQFLALGGFLEVRINLRLLRRLQLQFGEAAFVEDRHGGLVLNSTLDVVDGNVIAEHGARVGVGLFNRCAGEADERGVGQRVAHVTREAVNEIVLAAVRFVGNHHDVAAVGQQRMLAAFVLGEKLLDGGEHHAAGRDGEELFQMVAILGLHRFLPEQLMAAGERAEKLVVEVVAVGEDDECGILHFRLDHEPPGVKRHRERFA